MPLHASPTRNSRHRLATSVRDCQRMLPSACKLRHTGDYGKVAKAIGLDNAQCRCGKVSRSGTGKLPLHMHAPDHILWFLSNFLFSPSALEKNVIGINLKFEMLHNY